MHLNYFFLLQERYQNVLSNWQGKVTFWGRDLPLPRWKGGGGSKGHCIVAGTLRREARGRGIGRCGPRAAAGVGAVLDTCPRTMPTRGRVSQKRC